MALCIAAEGCTFDGPLKRGFCPKHYQQAQRSVRSWEGVLLRPLRANYIASGELCRFPECKKVPFANWLCQKHHQLFRYKRIDENGQKTDPSTWLPYTNPNRTTPGTAGPCKLAGCRKQRVDTATKLCSTHYRQLDLGIIDADGNTLREPYRVRRYTDADVCRAPGCGKKPRSNYFCAYHNNRFTAGLIDANGGPLRHPARGRPRKKNARWLDSSGYVRVRAPEGHPKADSNYMIAEHVHVMEQHLGRYLVHPEMVHHKDSNRQNNDISNLELRTRQTHPPGGEYTEEFVERALDALEHNNPEAYPALLKRRAAKQARKKANPAKKTAKPAKKKGCT